MGRDKIGQQKQEKSIHARQRCKPIQGPTRVQNTKPERTVFCVGRIQFRQSVDAYTISEQPVVVGDTRMWSNSEAGNEQLTELRRGNVSCERESRVTADKVKSV